LEKVLEELKGVQLAVTSGKMVNTRKTVTNSPQFVIPVSCQVINPWTQHKEAQGESIITLDLSNER
jgi:hypothetical protein